MKTTNKEKFSIAMSVKPPHRGGGLEGVSINDVCKLPPFGGGRGERLPLSSLTKSELAQLYVPGAPRSSALRLLHKYITSAHGLLPALERVGYQRASRRLTRRQVHLIFEYLGEP